MAGRKQFDVDEALEQAMRVFWQRGYADTSLDALGAATRLGRGSLYGTFGGKDALFRRCLDRYSATYADAYESALAGNAGDPVRAVEAFFDVALARIADPAVPLGCLIAQSAMQTPVLEEESGAHVRAKVAAQRGRVRGALEGAPAAPEVLDSLAAYVVAVNQGIALMSRAGTPVAELRTVARLARTTVADTLGRSTAE
ncbi:TetR/AcrR family transcriptional regulator [Streptomyces sp. NPDC007084]|uniref:TetR/AcrR family transcriptional regulator n=1 Tax=Streptomyces sp. NPDC007084 TaxID=3154313 RepID=UPI003451C952